MKMHIAFPFCNFPYHVGAGSVLKQFRDEPMNYKVIQLYKGKTNWLRGSTAYFPFPYAIKLQFTAMLNFQIT